MKKAKQRHYNIPIFIPHLGCPNDCVFCNQRKISGKINFIPENTDKEISDYLSSLYQSHPDTDSNDIQIAFFGGSFTGIDRGQMIYLLSTAKKYIDKGMVNSIRLSTRPDYISEEILDILKEYGVKDIELGIQSTSDEVLCASKRGHTFADTQRACMLIKQYGFRLGGQMMIGLPHSDIQKEIECARAICSLGADCARIYPTVILKDTELAVMTDNGEYIPMSEEDEIERTARVLEVFIENDVPVIRVGLCAQDNLNTETDIHTGIYLEDVGERAKSLLMLNKVKKLLDSEENGKNNIVIYCAPGMTSTVCGHKSENIKLLRERYLLKIVKVIEKSEISGYNILINYL